MKIALIIPSTSKGRDWKTFNETYLIKHTIKTFLYTYDKEHNYTFYIGIDRNDPIYDNDEVKVKISKFISVLKNIDLKFVYMDNVKKGHLTVMWNILFDKAIEDNNDYFFQCGDDIEFQTKGWINDCISVLKSTNGLGLVGPINNNPRILTQSFVSKKHKDLFGYYFPPDIINWFCDNWINEVYKGINHFYPLQNHFCSNVGGNPRYDINNDPNVNVDFQKKMQKTNRLCGEIVKRDLDRIRSVKNHNLICEDFFTKYYSSKDNLVITRKEINIDNFRNFDKENPVVVLTGYKHIIEQFFNNIIIHFKYPVRLIIIDSDVVFLTNEFLNNYNLLCCFTWNKPFEHDKLFCLPIGLNFDRQHDIMSNFLNNQNNEIVNNKQLLAINHSPNTNSIRGKLAEKANNEWNDFCDVLEYIAPIKSYIAPSKIEGRIKIDVSNPECYNVMKKYHFILSPAGAGEDTHRTWEAIYTGCIPIVKSSQLNELYKELPIVVVDDWNLINKEFLLEQLNIINNKKQNNEYKMNKMQFNFWINKINNIENKPKIHFITYANNVFETAKKRLISEAVNFNVFSTVKGLGPEDIPQEYMEKYGEILNMKRGGGYWIWKHIIFKETFKRINDGEYLVYLDAGCCLNKHGKNRFFEYIKLLENSDYGIVNFQQSGKDNIGGLCMEKEWTIKEIFETVDVDIESEHANSGQYLGGILIFKKNEHSKKYLEYVSNIISNNSKLVTDEYNKNGRQITEFKDNRHDQSITSLVCKKMGSIVIDKDESFVTPFGSQKSLEYPFWATRSRR